MRRIDRFTCSMLGNSCKEKVFERGISDLENTSTNPKKPNEVFRK